MCYLIVPLIKDIITCVHAAMPATTVVQFFLPSVLILAVEQCHYYLLMTKCGTLVEEQVTANMMGLSQSGPLCAAVVVMSRDRISAHIVAVERQQAISSPSR